MDITNWGNMLKITFKINIKAQNIFKITKSIKYQPPKRRMNKTKNSRNPNGQSTYRKVFDFQQIQTTVKIISQ